MSSSSESSTRLIILTYGESHDDNVPDGSVEHDATFEERQQKKLIKAKSLKVRGNFNRKTWMTPHIQNLLDRRMPRLETLVIHHVDDQGKPTVAKFPSDLDGSLCWWQSHDFKHLSLLNVADFPSTDSDFWTRLQYLTLGPCNATRPSITTAQLVKALSSATSLVCLKMDKFLSAVVLPTDSRELRNRTSWGLESLYIEDAPGNIRSFLQSFQRLLSNCKTFFITETEATDDPPFIRTIPYKWNPQSLNIVRLTVAPEGPYVVVSGTGATNASSFTLRTPSFNFDTGVCYLPCLFRPFATRRLQELDVTFPDSTVPQADLDSWTQIFTQLRTVTTLTLRAAGGTTRPLANALAAVARTLPGLASLDVVGLRFEAAELKEIVGSAHSHWAEGRPRPPIAHLGVGYVRRRDRDRAREYSASSRSLASWLEKCVAPGGFEVWCQHQERRQLVGR
ncbi:uncharacterized protein BXZ73DRAFT_75694 [Epithele typhae]|uniref:uncharacterized protein n=1 Tax=Epithele typhae TaxID=378194 RepID=UPI0020074E1B|nr:uncharacterized protein BXZ73DRAFT_75694 [Epithele typhae]KAH9940074.1 hypothetical protein BXZ73DRAFT_75694 [Epithele typhae]